MYMIQIYLHLFAGEGGKINFIIRQHQITNRRHPRYNLNTILLL